MRGKQHKKIERPGKGLLISPNNCSLQKTILSITKYFEKGQELKMT